RWERLFHCETGAFPLYADGDKTEFVLPADLNPIDIATIVVSDASGNPVLTGDLVHPDPGSTICFQACVKVDPGSAAPSTEGTVDIQSTAVKGKWKHKFHLTASGVPAR